MVLSVSPQTRLNVADDPTRDVVVRQPALKSILEGASFQMIQSSTPYSSPRNFGWLVRLVILLGFLPTKLHASPNVGLSDDPSSALDFSCPAAGTNWIFAFWLFSGISLSLWTFAIYQPPVSQRIHLLTPKTPKLFWEAV